MAATRGRLLQVVVPELFAFERLARFLRSVRGEAQHPQDSECVNARRRGGAWRVRMSSSLTPLSLKQHPSPCVAARIPQLSLVMDDGEGMQPYG